MAFLNEYDLKRVYRDNSIDKLLNVTNNLSELITQSVSEVKSYIQHRYDPDQVFYNVIDFSITIAFSEGDLIQYSETAWSSATEYALNDRISYSGKIYKSLQGTNINHLPDETGSTWWEYVCDNYAYFSAIQDTTGNYPEDTDYWTAGDIRDPSIVKLTSWLTIYELFSGGNPRTFPEIIQLKYDNSIDDLKAYQRGTRTVILPTAVDADGEDQGQEISYDSSTQKNWEF